MLKTKRRRLFFDIETSPNIGLFWEAGYKKNIDYSNIIQERAIICICYKWEDEKEVYSLQWDSKQNDKTMLTKFILVANAANELVGHNGDKFDLAWIRTRCLFHKIDMFPKYTTIDTLKVARSKFRFNSNRLNYIADFLGLGQKIKTEYSLWKDILLRKDKVAMEKMIKYCKKDVVLLENVFKALSSHIDAKTHYGVAFGQGRGSCPECGSDDLLIKDRKILASGIIKLVYRCKTCGKYHNKTDK
ncbi:Ribonuclease H-like domain containing protein [uncultured Caudovirales phage]|uniref:Ribonuclease H-like domain containing protein n=1 Tax=uncultured Caudovirales phage TaxID=2100421 RepID=A0A6J5KL87_9CAUD|nr:Ribonuclease H-like domain containing protein [uncultured Caudovirales phage]